MNCNFRQASSKDLITLEPKAYLFLLKIVLKNLISKRLAWVLARRARKERKLLARRENLLVPDDRTGVFSSPVHVQDIYGFSNERPWNKNQTKMRPWSKNLSGSRKEILKPTNSVPLPLGQPPLDRREKLFLNFINSWRCIDKFLSSPIKSTANCHV